jgi:hypothetical protein
MASLPSVNLQPGLDLQAEIWRKYRQLVGFSKGFSPREFFLLTSFGCSKFRLETSTVGAFLAGGGWSRRPAPTCVVDPKEIRVLWGLLLKKNLMWDIFCKLLIVLQPWISMSFRFQTECSDSQSD